MWLKICHSLTQDYLNINSSISFSFDNKIISNLVLCQVTCPLHECWLYQEPLHCANPSILPRGQHQWRRTSKMAWGRNRILDFSVCMCPALDDSGFLLRRTSQASHSSACTPRGSGIYLIEILLWQVARVSRLCYLGKS